MAVAMMRPLIRSCRQRSDISTEMMSKPQRPEREGLAGGASSARDAYVICQPPRVERADHPASASLKNLTISALPAPKDSGASSPGFRAGWRSSLKSWSQRCKVRGPELHRDSRAR